MPSLGVGPITCSCSTSTSAKVIALNSGFLDMSDMIGFIFLHGAHHACGS